MKITDAHYSQITLHSNSNLRHFSNIYAIDAGIVRHLRIFRQMFEDFPLQ